MTLEEHAAAISAAIHAAAADGFHLDNGQGFPPGRIELNSVDDKGDPTDWYRILLPYNPLW